MFDKVFVLLIQVAITLLFLGGNSLKLGLCSPFSYLYLTTTHLSNFSLRASTLHGTEVSAWHGAGFGMGSSLVLQVGAGLE